ncbi:MAG: efflux RND transporter permease subunit [Rhizobiales bacterium]|nr:efflux RND transporter permease subunit [Hyphomicrobiales bacterium]
MNPAVFSIKNRLICAVVILISLYGGWNAYETMPRLEDPDFTIRVAQIITQYPGATPLEVANEVSDKIESALQQLPEVKEVRSTSTAGQSIIQIEIKFEFSPNKEALQVVWTKVRNKVAEAALQLPPGAGTPYVNDDFGDVYGIYYALTSDGFSPREMFEYAKSIRTELLAVEGVGKVAIQGELPEAIYIEFTQEQLAASGISIDQIFGQLSEHSSVTAAGAVTLGNRRLMVQLPPTTETVSALENTIVSTGFQETGRVIRLRDIATVTRGYQDPARLIMRYNGRPSLAIGISAVPGENIVRIGGFISARLAELESERPIGLEIETYYNQADIVEFAVKDFAKNVMLALLIVLITLGIFMGLKPAIVIGGVLLLTIAATLAVMQMVGIPMHRISLGALIIALGMLVDNAIVVTDGILIGVKAGKRKLAIASEIVARTWIPLLGGTIVGIIAFAPVGLAPGATAEYTGDLFWVVMISLSFSWIFAITAAPLFADILFKESEGKVDAKPDGALIRGYKHFIVGVLHLRYLVIGLVVGLFAVAAMGFAYVAPGFFPASTSPQIVVDYWLPEGTSIDQTNTDMARIEDELLTYDGVEVVNAMIGGGTLRYMLVYGPESPNSSYGQILLRIENYNQIDGLIPEIQAYLDDAFPNAQAKVWRFQLGPGGGSKIQARFSGPNPIVLRELAAQAASIMAQDPDAISIKDDWRHPVSVIEPILNEARIRRLGVTREDIATALNVNFSGRNVGLFREGDNLVPIIQRASASARIGIDAINTIQVANQATGRTIPLAQLVDGFQTVWRDGKLLRVNRVWALTAQADPGPGISAGDLFNRLRPQIEAIALAPGYTLVWKGEYGDSAEANGDLASTIPMGLAAMMLTVLLLFNALRQPIIIFLTLPLAIIGVVFGLLVMGTPLEFMAILGVLSLSGLLIKNAIVLVDQMDMEIREGKARFDAIVNSAASRVRPVMMGSLTTVLGVIPLFSDAFFKSMAVVLVFGLSFATILTLVVIPALYAVFFRVKASERETPPDALAAKT